MKPNLIMVAANDVVMSGRLASAKAELGHELAALQRQGTAFRAFQSLRAWFSMERFIDIQIRGRRLPLSMDVNAAWVDEHGRTLDKIVKHSI